MSRKGENIYKRKDGRWDGRYFKEYEQNVKINSASVFLKILKKTDALIIIFYCKLLFNKQKWLVHFKNKNGAGKRT